MMSAQYLLTWSYAAADAAFVQPFDDLKLISNILIYGLFPLRSIYTPLVIFVSIATMTGANFAALSTARSVIVGSDDAAADNVIPFIKNSTLPRGHAFYIFVKTNINTVFVCVQVRKCPFIFIPYFGYCFHAFADAFVFYPVYFGMVF